LEDPGRAYRFAAELAAGLAYDLIVLARDLREHGHANARPPVVFFLKVSNDAGSEKYRLGAKYQPLESEPR